MFLKTIQIINNIQRFSFKITKLTVLQKRHPEYNKVILTKCKKKVALHLLF